jgi:hypothetical protein
VDTKEMRRQKGSLSSFFFLDKVWWPQLLFFYCFLWVSPFSRTCLLQKKRRWGSFLLSFIRVCVLRW